MTKDCWENCCKGFFKKTKTNPALRRTYHSRRQRVLFTNPKKQSRMSTIPNDQSQMDTITNEHLHLYRWFGVVYVLLGKNLVDFYKKLFF